MNIVDIQNMARTMRQKILEISYYCNLSTHLGGGLSMVDIMAVLYSGHLRFNKNNPRWEDRDRFILSKGHGVLGYFSALLVSGIINEETFKTFQQNESDLIAHPVMNLDIGIESSNGSLGQGLSMGVGIALAAKLNNKAFDVFVYMGDGECNEGAVWEAAMSGAQLKLDNLIGIVDYNKFQSDGDSRDIIDLGDLAGRFRSFGWDVRELDGHNIQDICRSLEAPKEIGRPRILVAHTVKGKGVSFMENNNDWHHGRLTRADYELAMTQLGCVVERAGL